MIILELVILWCPLKLWLVSDIILILKNISVPSDCRVQDGRPVDISKDHYEGGTIDQTTLTIKNSTRDDNGNYSCELANGINSSMSLNVVPISVYCKYPERKIIKNNPISYYFKRIFCQYLSWILYTSYCFRIGIFLYTYRESYWNSKNPTFRNLKFKTTGFS